MAALEIQQNIEDLMAEKNETAILEKIRYFRLYTEDDNVVKKRAGLYGISVIAVSLYQKVSKYNYLIPFRNLLNT